MHDSGRATMHAQIGTGPKGGREYNCKLHQAQIGTAHALQDAEQTVANGTACIGGADDRVRATMHAQISTHALREAEQTIANLTANAVPTTVFVQPALEN
jgi:hypothetical protein